MRLPLLEDRAPNRPPLPYSRTLLAPSQPSQRASLS